MRIIDFKTECSNELSNIISGLVEDNNIVAFEKLFKESNSVEYIDSDNNYGFIGLFEEVNEVVEFFEKYSTPHNVSDITFEVMNFKMDTKSLSCPDNILNVDKSLNMLFNKFLKENLTTDLILEKIKVFGMDSLNSKEREVLNHI